MTSGTLVNDHVLVVVGDGTAAASDDEQQCAQLKLLGGKRADATESAPSASASAAPVCARARVRASAAVFQKLKGLLLVLAASFSMSLSSVLFKKARFFSGTEQTSIRLFIQLVVMGCICKRNGIGLFGTERKLLAMRGAFGSVGIIAAYIALSLINPSDVVALINCSIIIVCILAKVFLNEKYSVVHLVAFVFTICGVFLIAQPQFLFGSSTNIAKQQQQLQQSVIGLNLTSAFEMASEMAVDEDFLVVSPDHQASLPPQESPPPESPSLSPSSPSPSPPVLYEGRGGQSKYTQLIGVSMGVLCAMAAAVVTIVLKKLSDRKVHYALTMCYSSYFGLPASLLISGAFLLSGVERKSARDLADTAYMLEQSAYSLASTLCGMLGQVFITYAFNYEDASKITLYKSSDVLFTFLLQFCLISIRPNVFSTVGAVTITVSVLMIVLYKIGDKSYQKKRQQQQQQQQQQSEQQQEESPNDVTKRLNCKEDDDNENEATGDANQSGYKSNCFERVLFYQF